MKNNKFLVISCFCFLLLVVSIFAAPNPRLGESVENPEQVLDFAKCYDNSVEDSAGMTFEDYFNQGIISEECQAVLDSLEIAYQEQSEEERTTLILKNLIDADGDKFDDEEEIRFGTDINNPNDFPWWMDIDGDGFLNEEELFEQTDPLEEGSVPKSEAISSEEGSWQIYLAIFLAILLIVFVILYIIYNEKYAEN
jgi:hypothetical protein